MATTTIYIEADSPARKRSHTDNDSPTFAVCPSPKKVEFTSATLPLFAAAPHSTTRRSPQQGFRRSSWDRGRRAASRIANMHAQNTSPFTSQMPSFMSVIQQDPSRTHIAAQLSRTQSPKESHGHNQIFSPLEPSSFSPFHQQRMSTSTSTTNSADSSPTTTVSLDASSMTEPSPGPSPQSPTSMSFAMNESRFTPIEASSKPILLPTLPIYEAQQRPASASKRPRNLKNLAVNTAASYNLGRAIATAPLNTQGQLERMSAPVSPSFVKPPSPPKRKLGKMSLTIVTPANADSKNAKVPITPLLNRPITLRHFQSSPSLPLHTSGAGPAGGMTLPRARAAPTPRGFAEVTLEEDDEEEQNFDVPQSREDKPQSYPNGPIRIYESGVDLFYEPSVEVASRYDVIINVASEVKNPFDVADEVARQAKANAQLSTTVGVLAPDASRSGSASPTTPKATPITTEPTAPVFPVSPSKRPEYIHIPWEHNTEIAEPLHDIVRTIDDRVKEGKKVLVHCQLGVSRSASVIVAYGLYTNPGMTVNEAYDAVKKRSKWISPNMSLIMQLNDFRTQLMSSNARKEQNNSLFPPRKSSLVASATGTDSFNIKTPSEPNTPRTAPFSANRPDSPQRLDPAAVGPFSAAPLETNGSFWDNAFKRRSWGSGPGSIDNAIAESSEVTDTNYVDATGHIVPVTVVKSTVDDKAPSSSAPILAPPPKRKSRPSADSMINRPLPFRRDYGQQDVQMTDAPSLDLLTSPQSIEFNPASLKPPAPANGQTNDMVNIMSPLANNFSTQTINPPRAQSFTPEPLSSPRAVEFHMAPLIPSVDVQSQDVFNILSPTSSDFPNLITFPSTAAPPVSAPPPPPPARAAPRPPSTRFDCIPMESLDSIFSPTSNSFPAMPAVQPHVEPAEEKLESERIDSMEPIPPQFLLGTPPKANGRLRKKFSAPNLSDCQRLQKIQTDIANQLPRRPAEAEEALLSPRVGEFTANPFHFASKQTPARLDEERETILCGEANASCAELPVTPTKSTTDPRSPAQFGISPITRNIYDAL